MQNSRTSSLILVGLLSIPGACASRSYVNRGRIVSPLESRVAGCQSNGSNVMANMDDHVIDRTMLECGSGAIGMDEVETAHSASPSSTEGVAHEERYRAGSLGYAPRVLVRDADLSDAAAIARIYNREVIESTHTFDLVERTVEQQRAYLRARSGVLAVIVACNEDTRSIGPGADTEGETIIGFGALSFYRDRPGYRTSVENSVYVHRDHQRQGVGNALLAGLIERAATNGFHAVFARVVDAQQASLSLHQRHGFELVGIEREVGRKFGRWLDVALLQRLL